MSAAPMQFGFEYTVRIAVSIPLTWATLIKEAAQHHYDWKCRESGERGVVNGLYNTAYLNEIEFKQHGPVRVEDERFIMPIADDEERQSTHPVSFSDLDLVSKICEQLHWHTKDQALMHAIHTWLSDTMKALSKQRELCMTLPGSAEPA